MSINGISGTQVWGNYQMPGVSQNSGAGGANAAGAARHNPHHGGGMMKGVMQTLNQLGITPSTGAGQDGAAGGASGNPAQTVRAFMHKLAGALSGQSGAQASGAKAMGDGNCASCRGCGGCPRGGGIASARGYSNSASGLQGLLQALGANPAQQNSSLSDLNSAFTQMVQALGGTGAADAAGKQVDLQSFLQALALNMGGQQLGASGRVNPTGGFVSAMA